MNMTRIKRFVHRVKGPPIEGGYEGDDSTDKDVWLNDGRAILKEFQRALNLPGTVRVNKAGPAVSGDIVLHGNSLYVSFTQGGGPGFMYRHCNGPNDFTGGANQWLPWDALLEPEKVLVAFRNAMQG